ncbi:hypothetical protein RYA05_06010 [Pseudomonas syringae pv. actinidiae]|nr:hypothetical protein [Pseudomonas syringae pv. actinidiae]
MAAMMGALISHAASNDRIMSEIRAIHGLLGPTGGVMNQEKACVELSMTQEELWERFVDKSVLCVWIHRDVYVPVFQFDGGNHIPYFHDLWDILAPKCGSLEISQFFVSYRVEFSDLCIRDLLCEDLEVWQISAIVDSAKYFKTNGLI